MSRFVLTGTQLRRIVEIKYVTGIRDIKIHTSQGVEPGANFTIYYTDNT